MMLREFFRHGSNALIVAGIAALVAAPRFGGPKVRALPLGAGALLFLASEYATHRFLLHAGPSNNAFVHGLQRRLHYDHHVNPAKLELLFLPAWALVPAVGAYLAIYKRVTRSDDATASLLLGNLLGLMYYEWVHYVAHVPYAPKTPYGRYIKKYHLWHHFKNEKLWFGVTNHVADVAYGTYRDVADVERSANTRVLFD